MSGYVDVKLPSVSTRGFTTWKTWKKQWCTLRPNSVKSGILIVFHASAGMSSTSQIEIPKGSVVHRTSSKTKDYAFGIYPSVDCHKYFLLMAGQSESESQLWMSRIRTMLNGKERDYIHHTDNLYVSIIENDFSNNCGFKGLHGKVKLNSDNIEIFNIYDQRKVYISFCDIGEVELVNDCNKTVDNKRIFILKTNSNFIHGQGQLLFFSLNAKLLTNLLKNKQLPASPDIIFRKLDRRKSRSEGTLFTMTDFQNVSFESDRDSGLSSLSSKSKSQWYYPLTDPSIRLSVNDDGYVLKGKLASTLVTAGILLSNQNKFHKNSHVSTYESYKLNKAFGSLKDDCHHRFSGASVSSGLYEEITEQENLKKNRKDHLYSDNIYEATIGSIYGTTRRNSKKTTPPPLPPRQKMYIGKFDSTSDSGLDEEFLYSPHNESGIKSCSIHSSIGSLNSCSQIGSNNDSAKRDMKPHNKFSIAIDAFRKRVQSDVQHIKTKDFDRNISSKYDTRSESSGSSSKKHFNFNVTPSKTKSILSNSKVAQMFKKIGGSVNFDELKNSAKSCETLSIQDDDVAMSKRCSKSEDNLDVLSLKDVSLKDFNTSLKWYGDKSDENIKDLSIICAENNLKNLYPDDVLDLILKGKTKLVEQKLKQLAAEEEYVCMSPIGSVSENLSKKYEVNTVSPQNDVLTENNYVVMKSV